MGPLPEQTDVSSSIMCPGMLPAFIELRIKITFSGNYNKEINL